MNLHPKTYEAYLLLHDGVLALAKAEQQGIRIDMDYVNRKKEHLTRQIERLEKNFKTTPFFVQWQRSVKGTVNINSGLQLGKFLYEIKKLKPSKQTESGQGSTDDEALRQLHIPELDDLLQAKKLKKIRDTYLDGFAREQVNGYIHPFFNLHLVKTFRGSSDSPNFQNIPKRDKEAMSIVRHALFPRSDHQLVEFDFSGAEVKVAACYHKDPMMLKYINDPTTDMHGDLAKQIFCMSDFDSKIPSHSVLRAAAKNGFIFPQFYGDYYKNCADGMAIKWGQLSTGKWKPGQGIQLVDGTLSDHMISQGIKSFDAFCEHVKAIEADFWGNRFAEYAAWKERWWNGYKKNGYVDFLTGFRASGQMGKNETINYPVQGASFHCLLWTFIALTRIMEREKWDSRLIGQIHDSIVMDINPKELDKIIEVVNDLVAVQLPRAWKWICVPMKMDVEKYEVNKSWADKIKTK